MRDKEVSGDKKKRKKETTKKASKKSASNKSSASRCPGKTTAAEASDAARKLTASRQSKKKSAALRRRQNADADCQAGISKPGEADGDPFEAARRKMKGSVPAIVDAMVKEAIGGHYSHAKTVLEMTGARRMFDEEARPGRASEPWAKRVLKKMEEAEEEGRGKAAAELAKMRD